MSQGDAEGVPEQKLRDADPFVPLIAPIRRELAPCYLAFNRLFRLGSFTSEDYMCEILNVRSVHKLILPYSASNSFFNPLISLMNPLC